MEDKPDRPRVTIVGGGLSSMAASILVGALASSMRETPIVDTLKAHRDHPEDYVIFERNAAPESPYDDLFGPLEPEIKFDKKPAFETAEQAYWRRMEEQAEREKPVIAAAEAKRLRKAAKRRKEAGL